MKMSNPEARLIVKLSILLSLDLVFYSWAKSSCHLLSSRSLSNIRKLCTWEMYLLSNTWVRLCVEAPKWSDLFWSLNKSKNDAKWMSPCILLPILPTILVHPSCHYDRKTWSGKWRKVEFTRGERRGQQRRWHQSQCRAWWQHCRWPGLGQMW